MHNAGYAPRLYATFENGLAYEYVPGDTLSTESCHSASVFPLVASMMARMHKLECGDSTKKEAMVWNKARQFINLTPDVFTQAHKQQRQETNYNIPNL
jgi:ethanolamine kinase